MNENVKQIVEVLSNTCFIISEEMSSKKKYKTFIETIYDYLKAGFEVKELRECPVYFRFQPDNEIHTLQLRHFLTNLMFWEPVIALDAIDNLDDSYIFDCTKLSSGNIKSYIDNKIVVPYRRKISNKKLNIIIHDTIFNLTRISTDFSILLGLTMNIESFINVAKVNPRFNEIIRTKLDENMQPNEIEETLHALTREEVAILKEEESALKPILRAGSGIKEQQLSEFSTSGGLKPDLAGKTIPIPINSNLVVGGLNSVTNYFIDSIGGRKSLILNKAVMGKSGHFARKVMLLVTNVGLRPTEDACGTVHSIEAEIKTAEHLKRFIGRYYRTKYETKYSILTGKEKDLIGQKIFVKSPITCASNNGICRECYGDTMFYTNSGLQVGAYAGAIITNPVSQSILSSKHILTTTTSKMEFNENFYKFFTLVSNEIMVNSDFQNPEDYSLVLIKDNIVMINELDEGRFNHFVTIFHVQNNKTGEMFEIQENDGRDLYLSPELIQQLGIGKKSKDIYIVNMGELPPENRVFIMEMENNELTRPLYNIMGLLDTKERRRQLGIETINDLAQSMIDLLIESKISSQSVHGEVILSSLIRSESNILERPDFRKYDAMDDIQILTVESALEKHPSVLISLSFQFLGRQLLNPLTFKKRGTSFIDPFYSEKP